MLHASHKRNLFGEAEWLTRMDVVGSLALLEARAMGGLTELLFSAVKGRWVGVGSGAVFSMNPPDFWTEGV